MKRSTSARVGFTASRLLLLITETGVFLRKSRSPKQRRNQRPGPNKSTTQVMNSINSYQKGTSTDFGITSPHPCNPQEFTTGTFQHSEAAIHQHGGFTERPPAVQHLDHQLPHHLHTRPGSSLKTQGISYVPNVLEQCGRESVQNVRSPRIPSPAQRFQVSHNMHIGIFC